MQYDFYMYDSEKNAVVKNGSDGIILEVDFDSVAEKIYFENPEDRGILARLAIEEPASFISFATRPNGLQDYVDVWNELN